IDPGQEVVRTRPEVTIHTGQRMASALPASNTSMRSDRNTYVGKRFFHVKNPHLDSMNEDSLSLGFGNKTDNLTSNFTCLGGSSNQTKAFALFMHEELGLEEGGEDIKDICAGTDRHCMYKPAGYPPILHGTGSPSLPTSRTRHASRCCDATMVRMGTSGGIGIAPGSVVITDTATDSFPKPRSRQVILDDLSPVVLNLTRTWLKNLFNCSKEISSFPTLIGHTMCTYDCYEGRGRLDGALCSFSKEKKLDCLKSAHKAGIRDIEMESTVFAAMCGLCGLKAAVVCVTLLDRLDCDQINLPHDVLSHYQQWLQFLISNFIKQWLGLHD
uniref:Uridine phosphorylase 2 n=1 Tax=Microcebus murinus TaxID=30608 RepID=A0A8C5UX22_MICMU